MCVFDRILLLLLFQRLTFFSISWKNHHTLYNWIHHKANILVYLEVHVFLLCHLLQPRKIFKIMKISHNFQLGLLLQMVWGLIEIWHQGDPLTIGDIQHRQQCVKAELPALSFRLNLIFRPSFLNYFKTSRVNWFLLSWLNVCFIYTI